MKLSCAALAAAVALEAQKIYDEIDLFGHAKRLSPVFHKHIQSFADHPLVGEAMSVGMMGALEVLELGERRQVGDVEP